jgi:hypothetical protein
LQNDGPDFLLHPDEILHLLRAATPLCHGHPETIACLGILLQEVQKATPWTWWIFQIVAFVELAAFMNDSNVEKREEESVLLLGQRYCIRSRDETLLDSFISMKRQ